MKMFLTRMGFKSKIIVTGDVTQIDLRRDQKSGLIQAVSLLRSIDEIAFIEMTTADVVRHPLVAKILEKYEAKE
jgi:phosphate starvation-inducible PhoH-like protein